MSTIIIEVIKVSLYISISILLIIALKNKFLSKYTSTFRYILCIGLAIRGIFIFKIDIAIPKFLDQLVSTKDNVLIFDNPDFQSSLHINILELAFYIWFIGIVIKSIYYINSNFKLYKRIKNLKLDIIDSDMYNILEKHINNLNIKKEIKIYKLDGIYSPMLIGIMNPTIVIPNRSYRERDLNYIFRHELIHYKRKDNIFKIALILLDIIHWFNPLVHLFIKYFDDQCELSCDELVINKLSVDEIKEYSMLLLDTIKYKNKLESSICVSYLSSKKSNIIKSRIEGILSYNKCKKGKVFILIVFLISFVSVISIDNNVYTEVKSMEINVTDPLDSEYVRKMVDKYGEYKVTIGKDTYSFSKSNGTK